MSEPSVLDMSDESLWPDGYQTRSGLPVRIYAVEDEGGYPIHGAVFVNGIWQSHCWTDAGRNFYHGRDNDHSADLVRKRRVYEGWANVYRDESAAGFALVGGYTSKEIAGDQSAGNRIACIPITFTEGEGIAGERKVY